MIESLTISTEAASRKRFETFAYSPDASISPFNRPRDQTLLAMFEAFHRSGGAVQCEQLVHLLRGHCGQPISVVARWIVYRQAINFEWRSQTMFPLFQFRRSDMALRLEVMEVIRELKDVYDDLAIACWFASPNARLGGATPADKIGECDTAVFDCARADRFISRG